MRRDQVLGMARWQPPPLADAPAPSNCRPKVRVDEQVVRKILEMNPELRKGRTTVQVRRVLEQGGSLATGPGGGDARSGGSAPSVPSPATQLEDTIAFFLRGKHTELESSLGALYARRRALDDEERGLKTRFRDQIAGFVAMLDPAAVAAHGTSALARHGELLRVVGVTPAELLEPARRARR
jgi:hypothetical protein